MSGIGRLLVATLLAGVLVAGLMLPYALGAGLTSNKVTAAIEDVTVDEFSEPPPERSTVLDADGNLITTLYRQNRESVPLSQINNRLVTAVQAIEDRKFKNHHGVDWIRTIRSVLQNAQANEITAGGSTLTQQYVKNYLFLVKAKTDAERAEAIEQTPIRKLREAKMALQIEQQMSKEDILERYLNLVAFGPSTYGAEAAAQRYFGVSAAELELPQAALLAGMINNPNKFNPITNFDVAMTRRNLVLDQMAKFGAISPAVAEQAKNQPSMLNPVVTPNGCLDASGSGTNGYFCQYVLKFLGDNGIDSEQLNSGGYTIRTTMDPKAMKDAKAAVDANADPSSEETKRIANVMAVVQPGESTRKVVALVANRPFGLDASKGQTVQRLTTTFAPLGAGSTFKIFTSAAALELGMGTENTLAVPQEYISPLSPAHKFHNSGSFPPEMKMSEALATSPNTAFVALEDQIGLDKVAEMSARLGLRSYNLDAAEVSAQFAGAGQPYVDEVVRQKMASFTLGVSPVSPLELSNVGATLASRGIWCPPSPVDSVADRNNELTTLDAAPCEQAVEPELASTLSRAMEGDLTAANGTSHAAAEKAGWTRIAAGKTGTTQDYKSSAYLGFTPQYSGAVVVWDYLTRPTSICKDPLRSCDNAEAQDGKGMNGGSVPAATWLGAMKPMHEGLQEKDFDPASTKYLDGSEQTAVPSVVGLQIDEATSRIEAAGFKVKAQSTNDSGAARNVVVEQNPQQRALPGTTVVLTVSTGGTG